jgi:hypothetical protein
MKRRVFLKRGLLGGALLALGGAGLALQPSARIAEPVAPLRVLDDRQFQVVIAVAARILAFGDEGAHTVKPDPVAVAHGVDEMLSHAGPEVQSDLGNVLRLLENALPAFLLDRRIRPFTKLDAAAQDRVLLAWRDSSLVLRRGAYQALRRMCFIAHYRETSAWRDVRYPKPPSLGGLYYDDSKDGARDVPAKAAP